MTIVISGAIMCHPQRRRMAEALRAACAGSLHLEIASDPEPGGSPSASRTAALAWDSVDDSATHHLVIQDDIEICEDFTDQLYAAVQGKPAAALTFFAHWGSHLASATRLGALCELGWTETVGCYFPTQAAILPAELARGVARFIKASEDPRDDILVHQYVTMTGQEAYLSIPGLVEHLDVRSIVGNDARGARHAACYFAKPDDRQRSLATLRPELLPYINPDSGQSQCYIRDGSPGMGGHYLPASAALQDRGISQRDVSRNLRNHGELTGRIDPALQRGLYESSCLLGAIASETRTRLGLWPSSNPQPEIDRLLALPVVRSALSTMAPGTLRTVVPAAELTRLAPALSMVVESGVRYGLQHSA